MTTEHAAVAGSGLSTLMERAKPYEALWEWVRRFGMAGAVLVAVMLAAYRHFATADEVIAIRCQLVQQSRINGAASDSSRSIRTALGVLKGQMMAPATDDGQKKTVDMALAEAIVGIDKALADADAVRASIISASAAGGPGKCAP